MNSKTISLIMNIYEGLRDFKIPQYAVVTSGTFDGVHIGHQKILARLQEISKAQGGEVVLITFWPHPRLVLSSKKPDLQLLSTLDEKARLLAQYGVHHLVILPFTQEFSQMSPEDFVQSIYIEGIGTQRLVIGYDHRFGKDRKGGLDFLLSREGQYPFEVEEIPRQDIEEVGVSSTKIRKALLEGDVWTANQYLGHAYELSGEVMPGDKIGRTLGFPTANVKVSESYKLIPADGIYAVKIKVGEDWEQGMLYLGNRPTLDKGLEKRIEVNIFDFDRDIYGEQVQMALIKNIRGDQTFDSLEEMQAQLAIDEKMAREALKL